jgi:hypothetical protein
VSHLNLVTVGQHGRIDRLAVDIRAVETANVDDLQFTAFRPEFGVAPADGDVVEEDVAARIAACGCDRPMQRESEPALGPRLTTSMAPVRRPALRRRR